MKQNTDSYMIFQNQVDETFHFSVLVAHAIPNLKKSMSSFNDNVIISNIIKPDFYDYERSTKKKLKDHINHYENNLSSYILLSNFSFFEAYIKNVLNELISFHGGEKGWASQVVNSKKLSSDRTLNETLRKDENILKLQYQKNRVARYFKIFRNLRKNAYDFPSDLLSHYGVKVFIEKSKKLKARELLNFLEKSIRIKFTKTEKENFEKIKEQRNLTAHGKPRRLKEEKVREYSRQLKRIVTKIDKHLIKNFFIIEATN